MLGVKLKPGVVRVGTKLESAGRFWDAHLVRWGEGGEMLAIKGWRLRSAAAAMAGRPRALLAWKDPDGDRWVGFGTNSNFYVQNASGDLYDITPDGLTPGLADSTVRTGYGAGPYGRGAYGAPRPDTGNPAPPSMPSMDLWDGDLVFCLDADKKVYRWELDTDEPGEVVPNAPTNCEFFFVTDDGFGVALCGSEVVNSDKGNIEVWETALDNQARSFPLRTSGQLMCGKKVTGGSLLLTNTDCWLMRYVGYPDVHEYLRQGSAGNGIISRAAIADYDQGVVWMGANSFFVYNGYVQTLPCEVWDVVFNNINPAQKAKITAVHLAAAKSVRFMYPSSAAIEIDRYVEWNYQLNCWTIGTMDRTCGADAGVFTNPLMCSPTGMTYEHEVGFDYTGQPLPYAETGPFQLGKGSNLMEHQAFFPDEKTPGDMSFTFFPSTMPDADETVVGPFPGEQKIDALFQGLWVRIRYQTVRLTDWRIGDSKMYVLTGDAYP
ncbi:hypothetical protein [Caulobacter sp. NIBR2454]|uniref:hypothetical protein n=1 Tax=Caulobacter sp. NIBR2454 TaxID=3015996 RepID=UPI0022B6520A|nr:hypothetical protein [Caulobacter sp. NIBR2454]